jgi:hypothetical protein
MSEQIDKPESEDDKSKRMAVVEAFAAIIKERRKDAIEGRAASGIEQTWSEDEAHYSGEDHLEGQWSKGSNTTDGLTERKKKAQTRSTVFLKITRPYCDSAAARVADMLLPTDDRNWALRPTPLPQMVAATKDTRSVADVIPQAVAQKRGGVIGAIKGMFGGQQPAPAETREPTVAEVAKQAMDKAKAQAEAAQQQIDDWLVECRYHGEVRKVIESSAQTGTGILKGPFPGKKKIRAAIKGPDGKWSVQIDNPTRPQSKWVSNWRFYPDPNCGDDIHKGSYTWEEDDITARRLTELKEIPGYIPEMIDLCLAEGPTSPINGTRKLKDGDKLSDKALFQIWYYHGQVSRKDMEAAGCKCEEGKEYYPCMVSMVNDRVVRVSMSTLDSGEFPYDVMVWQARTDHWAGVGVARQMRECQKGANAAIRNIMDNAGLGAGPQIIVNRNLVVPANGKWEITARKIWWTRDDADLPDASKAFFVAVIPIVLEQLMPILQFWLKEAEDVTGLPMLIQGQQGKAPETVGGMTMLNNNATSVLRRIARTFDDRITEPHIGRYYEYLLLHGDDAAKGDFSIDARGSSALIERDTQSQQLMQMVGLSKDPAYGLDPELVLGEVLKGMRFDLKRLQLSDEKKEQMAKAPPPKAPQVEAAEIREAGADKREQMRLQAQAKDADADRVLAQAMKSVDERLAMADLAAEERAQLQNHKVDLGKLVMSLRQQRELSPGPQVMKAPSEPAGRADTGMAYAE